MNTLYARRSRCGYWVIIGFLAAPGLSVAVCFQTNPAAQQQCLANEEREREQEEQARERQQAQEAAQERYQEQQRAQQEAQERYQEQQRAQQEAQERYQEQQRAQQEAQERYQEQQRAQQQAQQSYQEQQRAQQEAQQRYQEQQRAQQEAQQRSQEQQRAQQEAQQRSQEQQRAQQEAQQRSQEQQRAQQEAQQRYQEQQRAQQEAQQRSQEQQRAQQEAQLRSQEQQRAQQEAQQRSQEQQRVQLEAQRPQQQQRLIEEQAKDRIQPQYRAPEPAPQAASSGYTSPAQTASHIYRPGAENPADTPVSGERASPEGVKRPDGSVVYTPRPHGPLLDSNARVPVPVVPEAVRPHDSPISDAPPPPLAGIPHTAGFAASGVPGPNGSVVYRPRNAHESVAAAVEVTDAPPAVVTRVAVVQPATTGFTIVPAPVANQPLAIAVAQMQSAQAGCAQADAYQNYINTVVSAQNTTDQGIAQTLQALAANTSDPDLQNAMLSSIGQPDPINDALQQQMQGMASTYETVCQTRMANAQSALAQSLGQPTPATPGQGVNGSSIAAPGVQPAVQAGPAANPASTAAVTSGSTAQTGAQPSPPGDTPCAPTVASNLPSAQAPWGSWTPIGNTGLVFDVSRVNDTTSTWRFLNAGANTISSMQFNYTYVDANSGQQATQQDVLPYALAPRQSVGGWAAYTANTRGDIVISVTQMSCH
jgi:hypothetical protein